MDGKLRRAVPYASVYASGLLTAAHQAAVGGAPGLAVQLQQQAAQVFGDPQYDGSIAIKGSDWGVGLNFSALWELSADTRIGVAYRSPISTSCAAVPTGPSRPRCRRRCWPPSRPPYNGTSALDHNDSGASLTVRTPESLSFHGFHQLTPTIAIMGEFAWTREARLKQLRIDFKSTTADS
jgi:long-chain fatty acid transport protein